MLTADAVAIEMLVYLHDYEAASGEDPYAAIAHMWDQTKIDEAIGMVMAQIHGSPTMALARLRATAFRRGQSLVEAARDVVNRRLDFNPEPPEPGKLQQPW